MTNLPSSQAMQLSPTAQPSPKSYANAVILSGLVGFVGLQHFYLGRLGEGILDVGLTLGWVYCFAAGEVLLGVLFLVADFGHSLTVTILLLTGNFRDGAGRVVCYPGQKLNTERG